MSVFGSNTPKFIGLGDPDSATRTLSLSTTKYGWEEVDNILSTASANGYRTFTRLGAYATFDVVVNLFDYASPAASLITFCTYAGKYVNFYPYGDQSVRNSSDVAIQLFVSICRPFPIDETGDKEKLLMRFEPREYVDITNSLP